MFLDVWNIYSFCIFIFMINVVIKVNEFFGNLNNIVLLMIKWIKSFYWKV